MLFPLKTSFLVTVYILGGKKNLKRKLVMGEQTPPVQANCDHRPDRHADRQHEKGTHEIVLCY